MPKFIGKKKNVSQTTPQTHWPKSVSKLFRSLNEIPWFSLTAIGTLLGVLVLLSYFHSIDYFPTDFSALIGLGAAAAVSAIGLLCVFAFGLVGPTAIYKQYVSDEVASQVEIRRPFSEVELIGLQLGGVGLVFLIVAYPEFRDCGTIFNLHGIVGFGLLAIWSWVCLTIVLSEGTRRQRFERFNTSFGIAGLSMLMLVIIVKIFPIFSFEYFDGSAVFIGVWILAIWANARAAVKLPWRVAGMLAVSLFMVIPLLTDWS